MKDKQDSRTTEYLSQGKVSRQRNKVGRRNSRSLDFSKLKLGNTAVISVGTHRSEYKSVLEEESSKISGSNQNPEESSSIAVSEQQKSKT